MDTLTHTALGASIGEILLGKKVGSKAALWGAIAANIPDLDLLSGLFINRIEALQFHRGPTHSLVFCFIVGGIMGYFLAKRYREANLQQWSWLAFLALSSHVLLDCFNSVGAQLLYPFMDEYIAFGNIFYVDPVYTLLLLLGLFFALRIPKDRKWRYRANGLGLFFSSLYMIFTFANQAVADAVFTNALHLQGKSVQRKLTLPTPFNTFVWYTVAEGPTGYNIGYYHILDDDFGVDFTFHPKNHLLDSLVQDSTILDMISEVSDGYFLQEKREDTLICRDLRCGISYPHKSPNEAPEYYLSYLIPSDTNEPLVKPLSFPAIWASIPRTWKGIMEGESP